MTTTAIVPGNVPVMTGGLHVIFAVGGVDYAVPAGDVVQMESFTGATAVPGTPPWVIGLMQVRQRVLPVVDMRRRFGLPPAERHADDLDPRVVVVARGERIVALAVDRAREVLVLAAESMMPVPPAMAATGGGLVAAVARSGERLVLILDLDGVLGQESLHGQ